jgi:hypothetical protein
VIKNKIMWGNNPWDNDAAADWFGQLMKQTGFVNQVRYTLTLADLNKENEEITPLLRAAAYCLVQFGHVYVWPVDFLESDLKLGIRALDIVLRDDSYCYSEEIKTKIMEELKQLEARFNQISA